MVVTDNTNERILELINSRGTINTREIAKDLNIEHQKIVGAIKSLESLNNVINTKPSSFVKLELTEEGEYVAENGSHEAVIFNNIPSEGINQNELLQSNPYAQVGFSKAMSSGWLKIEKDNSMQGPKVYRKINDIDDQVQKCLQQIKNIEIDDLPTKLKQDYKKRKLIVENTIKSFEVSKGPNFAMNVQKEISDITSEMINDDSWKNKVFKKYNFNAMGVPPATGHFHPLMKVKTQFRQIFLEMGFTEMNTSKYVESSFWNFDALFQPQNHPARDEHDTFFIQDPQTSDTFPMDYLQKVKDIHSKGGHGSIGYNYDWKIEEAQKNILRTHTTANSARALYKLAQDGFKPSKYFSIDKVYRNETLDATHLAEFHQIEGVIADYNLSLANLMGVLKEFYKKLGMTKLRFKPTYNPYTEPSMEIYSYHEGLKKWVEIGNSGIFRPELLLPMGLPPDISVIAWGLSLERPTMILYDISNIRELVGHKVNLQMVYDSPICYFK